MSSLSKSSNLNRVTHPFLEKRESRLNLTNSYHLFLRSSQGDSGNFTLLWHCNCPKVSRANIARDLTNFGADVVKARAMATCYILQFCTFLVPGKMETVLFLTFGCIRFTQRTKIAFPLCSFSKMEATYG